MYGNVHRKIITNSPAAWSLAGVAKRLSFAIDNMKLPIANLVVDTPGGGNVNVLRQGDMEIWNLKSGGRKYFQFKLLRDDGTYLGEDDIESIKVYMDDYVIEPWLAVTMGKPILYVLNMTIPPGQTADILKQEDTLYNLKPDGTRKEKRYNPTNHVWTFDGYQRPCPYSIGTTETSDLTKPTSPPYMEGQVHTPAKKYNDTLEKYEEKKTKGYLLVVTLWEGGPLYQFTLSAYYRKKHKDDVEGRLKRGYGDIVSIPANPQEDASLILPDMYLLRIPYLSIEYETNETASMPGYVHYEAGIPEIDKDRTLQYYSEHITSIIHYYCKPPQTFYRNMIVRSSIPWMVSERIINNVNVYAENSEVHDADYDTATTFIITGTVISHSGSTGSPSAQINGSTAILPRTFAPVDITLPVTARTLAEMNPVTYRMTMDVATPYSLHVIDYNRDFIGSFNNYAGPISEKLAP